MSVVDERTTSVRREVVRFAIPGVLALVAVLGLSLWVARSIATSEATRDAESTAELLASTVIEPNLDDALVAGDPAALARMDGLVHQRHLLARQHALAGGHDAIRALGDHAEREIPGAVHPADRACEPVVRRDRRKAAGSRLGHRSTHPQRGPGSPMCSTLGSSK